MKPLAQLPPPRLGRRDFVALTSAAALAGGALVAGAPAADHRTSPRRRRVSGTIAPGAGFAPRGAAIPRLPGNDEAFLGSSPMLGGASPLSARRRNIRGRL